MADDRPNFEINPLFSRPGEDKEHPKFVLADGEMLPETAYQIVHDDSMLDGNARLNLATFVGTWMDGFASRLVAIMGVTYTGMYEPVKQIAAALDQVEKDTGLDIPIHVDGASGGFIAPFLQPGLEWDFRLDRVHSINTSGHKYGLVYPGLGWVVWRSAEYLPEDLIFKVSYLGGEQPTFALNFSRPGAQVLLQYYNFLRLGRSGYTAVQKSSHDVARHIAEQISTLAPFELWNDASDIPVFAWQLKAGYTDKWDLYDLSNQLRQGGWIVPAYPMPADLTDLTVQRIVVRNGLSMDLADALLGHLRESVSYLDSLSGPLPHGRRITAFHH